MNHTYKNLKSIATVLLLAIAAGIIFLACDNRELLKPAAAPAPQVDSIAFTTTKDEDTINLSTMANGGYTWKFTAFDSHKNVLPSEKLSTSIKWITSSGTTTFNNITLHDTTLSSGTFYYFKMIPQAVNGVNKFVIDVTNGRGKTWYDTITFFVKTYSSVPYTYTLTPKVFTCLRPTSNLAAFNLTINSGDPSKTMKYYLDYSLPSNVTNSQGTLTLGGNNFASGGQIAIGSNNFTLSLTGHPTGLGFKMPIKIVDANGDFKLDTITYSVEANQAPVITTAGMNNFTQTFVSGVYAAIKTGGVPSGRVLGTCGYTPYRDNLYNIAASLNLNCTDDGTNCNDIPVIQSLKITLASSLVLQYNITGSATITQVVPDGTINYRYPCNQTSATTGLPNCVYSYNEWCFCNCPSGTGSTNNHVGYINGTYYNIDNNGTSVIQASTVNINPGDVITISIQDAEGAWSQPFNVTVGAYTFTAPAVWQ